MEITTTNPRRETMTGPTEKAVKTVAKASNERETAAETEERLCRELDMDRLMLGALAMIAASKR